MSEHHRVHKTDAMGQPRGSEMRAGIQYVHCKEDQAKIVFGDSEAAEEPISDQGIGQKATAKSIERKQSRELRDNSLAFWRDPGIHLSKCRCIGNLNRRGEQQVKAGDKKA